MDVEHFLAHHNLTEHPFDAEEARHDDVFERMMESNPGHPDFLKILGQIDPPSTAIVFGEKGSGKTAIRMLIGRRVEAHNREHADRQALLVAYDDLNPVLDRVMSRRRRRRNHGAHVDHWLDGFRLEDHQDAVLGLAVTRVVDMLTGQDHDDQERPPLGPIVKKMPKRLRVDLAVLAALYDQPRSESHSARWRALRTKLRLGWIPAVSYTRVLAILMTAAAIGFGIYHLATESERFSWKLLLAGLAAAAAVLLWGRWAYRHLSLWSLCRRMHREMPGVDRTSGQLRKSLTELGGAGLGRQSWPVPGPESRNSRYDLTAGLIEVLEHLGYRAGLMVVIDRIDEPTAVSGNANHMRSLVWPMFDNKFLQQDRVGLKLLLPLELRHMLHRESAEFFQEARLDKQHLVDRLTWSGATLYDLCSNRLRACCDRRDAGEIVLTDLFEDDVSRDMLVDALDQMRQPRDAFKFLYGVVAEHCRVVPDEAATFKIPRLTLDSIRRSQSQRVQELYRGLAPA